MQEFILSSVSLILIPSHHLHGKCKSYPFPTPSLLANLQGAYLVHVHTKADYVGFFALGIHSIP